MSGSGRNALTGIGFLFEYPPAPSQTAGVRAEQPLAASTSGDAGRRARPRRRSRAVGPRTGGLSVGFIGAGNYASSMLLPHLAGTRGRAPGAGGDQAFALAGKRPEEVRLSPRRYRVEAVLDDDSIDAVFIVTRHSSHADLVCRALRGRKGRLRREAAWRSPRKNWTGVLRTVDATGNDRLMVGFNRRFAPLLTEMRARFGATADTTVARYLVNAGTLAADSWYGNEDLEGSRFVGRGWPFHRHADLVDRCGTQSRSLAMADREQRDLHVVLRYADGSLASITYVTNGHPRFPKETFEVSSGGRSAPPRQLQAGHGLGRTAQAIQPGLRSAGQGTEGRDRRLPEGGPDRCADADLVVIAGRHYPGDPRRRHQPRQRVSPGPSEIASRATPAAGTARLADDARRVHRLAPAPVPRRCLASRVRPLADVRALGASPLPASGSGSRCRATC